MDITGRIKKGINIVIPFLLGGVILWWMYRDADLETIASTDVEWGWMAFSLVFGVTAQLFRALRWKQSLEPLDEHPRLETCIHGVSISYASSLIIPRSGEVARCGVLKHYDNVNFAKAIGTVVAERAVDSILLLCFCLGVITLEFSVFDQFFLATGTNLGNLLSRFSTTGYIVTLVCLLTTVVFIGIAIVRLSVLSRLKQVFVNIKEGIFSLNNVSNKPLLFFYSVMIWVSYFLHYWITFYCFSFTEDLSLSVALISFIVGSISVIVPTPNGAGPWHFSVKTILVLFGVADTNAITFVLIVHTVQTALMPLLGVLSLIRLHSMRRIPQN